MEKIEDRGPSLRSMQLVRYTENVALSGVGLCVMAGAVVAAEMLVAGEEIAHRVAAGLTWA